MNPFGLLVVLLGILLIIIGVKGTQHQIAEAITGKKSATPSLSTNTKHNPGTMV